MDYNIILNYFTYYMLGMFGYVFLKYVWYGIRESELYIGFSFKELIFYPIHIIQWLGYVVGSIIIFVIGRFI